MPAHCPLPDVHYLACQDYASVYADMVANIQDRIAKKQQGQPTQDAIWVLEHPSVYTLGQAGKPEHILKRDETPVIKTDRGGQVTWHGRGQLVCYLMYDLTALNWHVRNLVDYTERAICQVVTNMLGQSSDFNLLYPTQDYVAKPRADAPGVYVYRRDTASNDLILIGKIASLGFKIKRGISYHGLALNVDCDLSAFSLINPCGHANLPMCRISDFIDYVEATQSAPSPLFNIVQHRLLQQLLEDYAPNLS